MAVISGSAGLQRQQRQRSWRRPHQQSMAWRQPILWHHQYLSAASISWQSASAHQWPSIYQRQWRIGGGSYLALAAGVAISSILALLAALNISAIILYLGSISISISENVAAAFGLGVA